MGPTRRFELQAERVGYHVVAGVDEAGRGALAGPVVAAAVILPPDAPMAGLDDSKRLSASAREALVPEIHRHAVGWAIGIADTEEVDELNVLRATVRAMIQALQRLRPAPDYALIDGRPVTGLPVPSRAVIRGDAKSVSIAAASVLAKMERDRIMCEMDARFPEYGFAQHKGYGTRRHREALFAHGPCAIHRRSFRPVRFLSQRMLRFE